MKELLCKIFGHVPKEYPPLKYWIDGKAIDSKNKPIFCKRCGCGEIQMMIDKM